MPEATVVYDLPIGEYHALPRLSSSKLGPLIDQTPAHFAAKTWGEPSSAMKIGTAIHVLVLEPENYERLVPVRPKKPTLPKKPDLNFKLKANKPAQEAWLAECDKVRETWADIANWEDAQDPDATLLTDPERTMAEAAAGAILSHPGIQRAGLLEGRRELTVLFDLDGCPAKVRFDVFNKHRHIVDVKSCGDASLFEKDVANYGYHRQDALYSIGAQVAKLEPTGFFFVVVETSQAMLDTAPEDRWRFVRVVALDPTARAQGKKDVFAAAKTYKECMESGVWPGFKEEPEIIKLPVWAIDYEEEN